MFNDVCNAENSTAVWWDLCIGGEEKMAAGAAACSWNAEVAGITVCGEYHVAAVVGDDCIFLCGEVV